MLQPIRAVVITTPEDNKNYSTDRSYGSTFSTLLWAAFVLLLLNCPVSRNAMAKSTPYKTFGYPWENSSLGRSEQVPPPWIPIQIAGDRLICWGKEYLLNGGILPEQISSQGQELFQRPPSLNLTINKQNAFGRQTKPVEFVIQRENIFQYKIVWGGTSYRVEAVSTLEFDGLFKVDLHVLPKAPIQINQLDITFPFRKKEARMFSRFLAYDYKARRVDKEDLINSFGTTDKVIDFEFNPSVWIGNHDVGMEWVCETNAGWSNIDPSTAIHISSSQEEVLLRINVISKNTTISSPFTISFALYPTPVKKIPHDWRNYLLMPRERRVAGLNAAKMKLFALGFGLATKFPGLPILEPSGAKTLKTLQKGEKPAEQIINEIARMAKADIHFIPYGALYGMPARMPGNIWQSYGKFWRSMNPQGDTRNPWWAKLEGLNAKEPSLINICPYSESFHDFLVWQYVESIKNNKIAGLYLDLSTPLFLCFNPAHPHGKFVAGGGVYYPFFRQRELMKRLYVACKTLNPDFLITQHVAKDLPICSGFADLVISGEALNLFFLKGKALPKSISKTIATLDASFYVPDYGTLPAVLYEVQYSQKKGYINMLLPQVIKWNESLIRKRTDLLEAYSRSLLSRAVVYDIPLYFSRMDIDAYDRILGAWQRFGRTESISYLGPWESDEFLATGGSRLTASCYIAPGGKKVMLVVANLSDRQAQETVSLDLPGLKRHGVELSNPLHIHEAIDDTVRQAVGNAITVRLDPDEFHMLIIK